MALPHSTRTTLIYSNVTRPFKTKWLQSSDKYSARSKRTASGVETEKNVVAVVGPGPGSRKDHRGLQKR